MAALSELSCIRLNYRQRSFKLRREIAVNGKQVASTNDLFWAGYASLVYLPATVGPAGLAKSGLPVGYQAIAASGCDKAATAFSRFLEKEIVGFIPPPGFD
jgi:amidase